jgi:hypothetical protein
MDTHLKCAIYQGHDFSVDPVVTPLRLERAMDEFKKKALPVFPGRAFSFDLERPSFISSEDA